MISVIIPTFNSEKYIQKCILSVLENSYQNFEIIIIDDGSTDMTVEIVNSINDSRVRLYKQKRKGPGLARNKGIDFAQGEYLFFLDSDDVINKSTLELLINNIGDNDIIIGDYNIIYDNGMIDIFITPKDCRFNSFFESVTIWNRLYKIDFIRRNKIRFEQLYQGEDRLFLADIYLKKPKFNIINIPVYNWLRHETDIYATLTHVKDNTNFDGQVNCMMQFKTKLENNIDKKDKKKLLEHLRYSCVYLLDILENSNYDTCDMKKFNIFVKSLKFEDDKELYSKIFKKDVEM